MPPRKKTRGTLKRSSSDGPAADDSAINSKRLRPDVSTDTASHISPDAAAAAHRARKPVTYKSKARQKAGLGATSPPKLTSFGFNVEHKPKVGRALFHLSPSPRAKARAKSKLFGSPKARRKRASKSGGNTSAENSRIEPEPEEDEEEVRGVPEPNNSFGTSPEHDEADDHPAPLPTLPAIRPIEGPGLEIRTPLKGRIIPPSLQSLSKRNPRTDATPVPLFAATPRHPPSQLPDNTNFPTSPTKPYNVPLFAPTNSHAPANAPVPSTPSHKPRSVPIFTPSVHRNEEQERDGSPMKKPPPVFAPTPARPQRPESSTNPFNPLMTPAHLHILPTAPPALPTMSSALPATDVPATPTAKGRSLPVFTPKLLFPPSQESEEETGKEEGTSRAARGNKVSKAPMFGVLEEGEESTPRAGGQGEQNQVNKREADAPGEPEDNDEGDVSMADIFNASTCTFSPTTQRVLTAGPGSIAPMNQHGTDLQSPLQSAPITTMEISSGSTSRVTRSRSRSASASGDLALGSGAVARTGSATRPRAGSQVSPPKAGSVVPSSRAGSVVPDSQPEPQSRGGSVVPVSREDSAALTLEPMSITEPVPPSKTRSNSVSLAAAESTSALPVSASTSTTTPHSMSISLAPLVTDSRSLAVLKSQSRTNSVDEYRTSQTAAMMMGTPGDERPSTCPSLDRQGVDGQEGEDLDPETSPLSSIPEDMSFSFLDARNQGDTTMGETVGDTTGGDTTMQDTGETTVRNEPAEKSMQLRDPSNNIVFSPPFSPSAPTSPVSSVPGDAFMYNDEGFSSPKKRPLPSSSPTRPSLTEGVLVPISDVARSIPSPDTRSRSSSLTSLSDLSDGDVQMEVEMVEQDKGPAAETRKSMIPVAKRPMTPGPGPRAQTPGAKAVATGSKAPFGGSLATPAPSRNGALPAKNGVASVKNKGLPTPGTMRNGALPSAASSSKLPALVPTAPGSATAALGMGKPLSVRSMATRTRSGSVKGRSLAAPTASTAAKTRAKVVTAPSRGRITSFMKPNLSRPPVSSSTTMLPPPAPTASTSVSPRKGQSKDDSDIRGPRRSMISQDTQASLSSLSSALEKLAKPSFANPRIGGFPPRPGTSLGFTPRPGSSLGFSGSGRTDASGSETELRSSVGPGGSKPMVKSASVATAAAPDPVTTGKGKGKAKGKDAESGDDGTYEEPGKSKARDDPNAPLRSCVIFVDVRTAEGEDAGSLFVDMLRGLGGKIVSRPTPSTTHIVFKSGHQSTLTKYKLYDDPQPFLVGIGWVVECVEKRARVDEENFKVKTDQVSALDLKKRRKSQLPHQMQFLVRDPNPTGSKFGSMSAEATAVSKSLEASAAEVLQDAELAAERGKQRMQQKLFPRVRDRSPS